MDEKDLKIGLLSEPVATLTARDVQNVQPIMPDHVDYASVVDGVLQITPDIANEIEETERGETLSMAAFKKQFARWLD